MNRKTLVILAGLLLLTAMVLGSCAQPTPETKIVEKVVEKPVEKIVEKPVTVIVPAPTAAPKPTEAPKPVAPTAKLEILAVPMNAALPGAITTTLKYITDTAVPAGGTAVIAYGATGLTNVPVNVPVRLASSSLDPKVPVTVTTWTLTGPTGSKVTLKPEDRTKPNLTFTPDVPGIYKIDVVLGNAGGNSPMASVQLHAGTYIGVAAGNCKQCHTGQTVEWEQTNHAKIFAREIDKPTNNYYYESCIYCHTTGYHLNADNGGFDDAQAKTGWKFPVLSQVLKGGNWATVPAEVKAMAGVQCEVCHGPAKEHAVNGARVMASSIDAGVCNVCHNSSARHYKGTDLTNAKHSTGETFAYASGPARQACVRCHSGAGFVSFLKNPTTMSAWDNSTSNIECSTCHDPHSDKFAWQLRIAGKPVALPFEAADVGLSAVCYECHNARTKPADAIAGTFPHYSSIAEFMSNTGGVTYGQTVPNSPHGTLVGAAPIPNPAAATSPTAAKFLFSYPGKEGNKPGPCVVCHMWPTIEDAKDPNYHKVGAHSFNTVSPDGKFDYTASCKSCHGDIKDFNLKAKADYDGNGKVEGVKEEIKGLLNALWKALEAKGVKQSTSHPYWVPPRDAQNNVDDKLENAFYNFRTVYGAMWSATGPGNEGKAQAVHNFKRSCALLQLSIKDLTGSLPAGATDCTK